jgi:hypothetical protein
MATNWSPGLRVCEASGWCRLWVGSYTYGQGSTLQEAADDLVRRLLGMAMSFRSGGARFSTELGPIDVRWFEFIYELGEIASAGGDIRERVFGPELEAA